MVLANLGFKVSGAMLKSILHIKVALILPFLCKYRWYKRSTKVKNVWWVYSIASKTLVCSKIKHWLKKFEPKLKFEGLKETPWGEFLACVWVCLSVC